MFHGELGELVDPNQAASDETEALLRQTGSPAATLSDLWDLSTGGTPPVTDESGSGVTPFTGRQDIVNDVGEQVDPHDAGPSKLELAGISSTILLLVAGFFLLQAFAQGFGEGLAG